MKTRLFCFGWLMIGAVSIACGSSSDSEHPGTRELSSGDLTLQVMLPDHDERYYVGSRFTPVAAVLSARVGDQGFFSNPVEHDSETEHAGLASEFDLSTPPPGHAEAAIGEGFVKVGVGILKKTGANYFFWNKYEVITPAETTVEWGENSAAFRQVCEGVSGYAYTLQAVVTVAERVLTVDWTLSNTGQKPIATDHYVHNFFRLGDRPVGPDYVISFPFDFEAPGLAEEQTLKGREIHFAAEIPKWVNIDLKPAEEPEGPQSFTVSQTATGLSIRGTTSPRVTRTAIHATKSHLCPEQFIHLEIEPGKKANWQRRYEFGVGNEK